MLGKYFQKTLNFYLFPVMPMKECSETCVLYRPQRTVYQSRAWFIIFNLCTKFKKHNITILYNVFFPFHSYFSVFTSTCPATKFYQIFPVDRIGFDEFLLKIRMNHAGCLWCCPSFFDGPCANLDFPSCKVILQSE